MLLDDPHQHVFILGLASDNLLIVMNTDGTLAKSFTDLNQPLGMALDSVSGTLYVFEYTNNTVQAIDTTTLLEGTSYPLAAPTTCPQGLEYFPSYTPAFAGGKLWFASTCRINGSGIGAATALNPTDGSLSIDAGYYPPIYNWLSVPGSPNELVGWSGGQTGVFDATVFPPTGTPRAVAGAESALVTSSGNDVIFNCVGGSPGFGCGTGSEIDSFQLPGLTPDGAYQEGYPGHIAATQDGSTVFWTAGDYPPEVWVFKKGAWAAANSVSAPAPILYMISSADGKELFAVMQGTTSMEFGVIYGPIEPPSVLTLSTSATHLRYHSRLTIKVRLSTPVYNQTANHEVDLTITPRGLPAVVKPLTVDSTGRASLTIRVTRNASFSASYAGDNFFGIATSQTVNVGVVLNVSDAAKGFYAVSGPYHLYHFTRRCQTTHKGCPTFLVETTPPQPGQSVELYLQVYNGHAWHTALNSFALLNAKGRVKILLVYKSAGVKGERERLRAVYSSSAYKQSAGPWTGFEVTT